MHSEDNNTTWTSFEDDRDLQNAFEIILFNSNDAMDDDRQPKPISSVPLESPAASDMYRFGDGFSRRSGSVDFLDGSGWPVSDLDEENKPNKEARIFRDQRSWQNDISFEKWHGERQAQLESNVLASMSRDDLDQGADICTVSHAGYSTSTSSQYPMSGTGGDDSGSDVERDDDDDDCKKSRKRPNVREHSKAQREKRKAIIQDLETNAKALTAELNESDKVFKNTLEQVGFKRKYFYDMLKNFLTLWITGDGNEDSWQALVDIQCIELALPITTSRFSPPGQIINGRRYIKGLQQIMADSSSIALMCTAISNLGRLPICQLSLEVDIPYSNFFIEGDTAFADVNICSRNAVICGGSSEMHIDGLLRCGFSNQGNLQWVDLYYNECDMQQQLTDSFGVDIYPSTPDVPQMVRNLSKPSSSTSTSPPQSIVITTLDTQVRVLGTNDIAEERIGQVVGRTLITANWVTSAVRMLSEWAPYSCQLDSKTSSGQKSNIFCQLYPYCEDMGSSEGDPSEQGDPRATNQGQLPNRIVWVMTECPAHDVASQVETMIRQLIRRVVDTTMKKINESVGHSCQDIMSVLSQAELLFNMDDSSPPSDTPINQVIQFMENFLKWVEMIDSHVWSDEGAMLELAEGNTGTRSPVKQVPTAVHAVGEREPTTESTQRHQDLSQSGKSSSERSNSGPVPPQLDSDTHSTSSFLEEEYNSGTERDDEVGSVYSETQQRSRSNSMTEGDGQKREFFLFMHMANEIDCFFAKIRDSSTCPHIISLLRLTSSKAESQVVEEFICYCLSKHGNPRVRFLMRQVQDLIKYQQFENAVGVLGEIISIDPTFIEAYNRRATALYGLRRAQECFADLEHVLKHNPLHYGALYGKGLLLMNLKAFAQAIVAFETVLQVNPRLASDESILNNLKYCQQHVWSQAHTNRVPNF
mmetsp:Transcript_4088/g.6336  ORF Transcript_4088/g.6336 Transcript_4088/m.6336 type:complete len:927 (+) Transcript_4088:144-2924(+)|eukprot:CAMPEP_0185031788 /NCGR_PEP_ID=MMETSP1103-20130426/19431_1 /TAXON_ID=36769 /ORGANISM="Paraphysomonas bandaiensis, Strain Caron Lab Isolate" /LENGTH=926 /DNA_ID=CAMNT_0027567429 /DNA_START=56 /DNA_END=2836 /DNA_ORIENTATION=-